MKRKNKVSEPVTVTEIENLEKYKDVGLPVLPKAVAIYEREMKKRDDSTFIEYCSCIKNGKKHECWSVIREGNKIIPEFVVTFRYIFEGELRGLYDTDTRIGDRDIKEVSKNLKEIIGIKE